MCRKKATAVFLLRASAGQQFGESICVYVTPEKHVCEKVFIANAGQFG